MLKKAIVNEDEQALIKCLDFRQIKKIIPSDYDMIEKALWGTWHSQHEDLVNIIYLGNLNADRFVDPILNIALNKEVFRWYDDELEATLRKCVDVLIMIGSDKANEVLKKLVDLDNENVKVVLEMYKQR